METYVTETPKKKLDDAELEAIREARSGLVLRTASLSVRRAEMDLLVTKAFVRHQVNNENNTICLDCGTFNPRGAICDCSPPA